MNLKATRAAVALVAAGALALTGCADKKTDDASSTAGGTSAATATQGGGAPSSKPLDANGLPKADIVQEAAKATRETYSEHLVLTVDKAIQGLPVASVDGDITSDKDSKTVAAKGDANVRVQENYVQTKFVVIDGHLYANLGGPKFQDMGKTGEKGVYDPSVILDMDKGLAKVVESIQNPKVESRETVNGLKTVKVTGTVSPQLLDPILPQITEVAKRGNVSTLPLTLWIVDESGADPQPRPNVAQMRVTMQQGNIDLKLSDFGKQVSVEKPAM
ncbi:LppX_LprAFG lipoprotein [Tsukamurella sp. 1534]|uniref:LppX_LprAFG lipoprotein n=1 Tax=Tsukamurella sp. 1534 TaxID=1151061 RepID=UPI000319B90F|nr:LppX_LprAFG lipoprotein [Tsukamurella sp. 1534]